MIFRCAHLTAKAAFIALRSIYHNAVNIKLHISEYSAFFVVVVALGAAINISVLTFRCIKQEYVPKSRVTENQLVPGNLYYSGSYVMTMR